VSLLVAPVIVVVATNIRNVIITTAPPRFPLRLAYAENARLLAKFLAALFFAQSPWSMSNNIYVLVAFA